MATRGFQTIVLQDGEVKIFTSGKLVTALKDITDEMTLFHGVKLLDIFDAIYLQGKKDGAREAFSKIEQSLGDVKAAIPHINPGRPKRKKIPAKKTLKRAEKTRKKKS
jgi:hypothetical protein